MNHLAPFSRTASDILHAAERVRLMTAGYPAQPRDLLGTAERDLMRHVAQERERNGMLMEAFREAESMRRMMEEMAATRAQALGDLARHRDMLSDIARTAATMQQARDDLARRADLLRGAWERESMVQSLARHALTPSRELLTLHALQRDPLERLRDAHDVARRAADALGERTRAMDAMTGGLAHWQDTAAALERQTSAMRELAIWRAPYQDSVRAYLDAYEGDQVRRTALGVGQWASALFRSSDQMLGTLALDPTRFTDLPALLRGTSVVAPYLAARTADWVLAPTANERDEIPEAPATTAATEQDVILDAAGGSIDALIDEIAAWRPDVAVMLRAALMRAQERGPEFAAHVAISLRRAVETTLDCAAPVAIVANWTSPRNRPHPNGSGAPTRGSRLRFALQAFENSATENIVVAQIKLVDAVLQHANGAIHIGRTDHDAAIVLYNLHQVVVAVAWIAMAQRLGGTPGH